MRKLKVPHDFLGTQGFSAHTEGRYLWKFRTLQLRYRLQRLEKICTYRFVLWQADHMTRKHQPVHPSPSGFFFGWIGSLLYGAVASSFGHFELYLSCSCVLNPSKGGTLKQLQPSAIHTLFQSSIVVHDNPSPFLARVSFGFAHTYQYLGYISQKSCNLLPCNLSPWYGMARPHEG